MAFKMGAARSFRVAAAVLAIGSLALATAANAANLKWANNGDMSAVDPYTRNETFQLSFLENIYEPLIRRDANLQLEPALALKWEMISLTVWRFNLRQGVKWQDGTPFTADDVVFSAARVRDANSVLKSVLGSVKEVRKIDDLTVEFETTRSDPIFPQEITTWFMMSRAWCEKNDAVDAIIDQLVPLLEPGDMIIDGGNSLFTDSQRRTKDLAAKNLHFLGTGISGGEEGALKGPSIMPGGPKDAWEIIKPIFTKISAHVDGEPCCRYMGPDGAGHYVKMVHNGIEYGDMQLICEAYAILTRVLGMQPEELHRVFDPVEHRRPR